VFGCSIDELLSRNDTENGIPFVVKTIVDFLLSDDNPKIEGLFRISGNAAHVRELKNAFDKGNVERSTSFKLKISTHTHTLNTLNTHTHFGLSF
jgi:hypothetical protein